MKLNQQTECRDLHKQTTLGFIDIEQRLVRLVGKDVAKGPTRLIFVKKYVHNWAEKGQSLLIHWLQTSCENSPTFLFEILMIKCTRHVSLLIISLYAAHS